MKKTVFAVTSVAAMTAAAIFSPMTVYAAEEYSVSDVTAIQKHVASIALLPQEKAEEYDFDGSGELNILDATILQKMIAKIPPYDESEKQPTYINLDSKSTQLKVGESFNLTAETDADDADALSWTTSDSTVVRILSQNGGAAELYPMKQGSATVTVSAENGVSAECEIKVFGSVVQCLDISVWQGDNVDFKKIKASGVDYVIIRAGYGKEPDQKDKHFERNYANAKAAGIKVGCYWFSYAMSADEALEEAKACLSILDGKKLDLPLYYDLEYIPAMQNNSVEEYTDIAFSFCNEIERAGYKKGVYASANVYKNELDYKALVNDGISIWNAEWNDDYSVDCDLWQYTDSGTINGIDTVVDRNYIFNLNIAN